MLIISAYKYKTKRGTQINLIFIYILTILSLLNLFLTPKNSKKLSLTIKTNTNKNTILPFDDIDNSYKFSWSIEEKSEKINIELDVATLGWAGIGFNSVAKMPNADIIMCFIDEKNKANCSDRKALGRKLPVLDSEIGGKDNLERVSGEQANGRTVFRFSRLLDTGDEKADFKINRGRKVFVLFSYRINGSPENEGEFKYHSRRTVKEIVLWP